MKVSNEPISISDILKDKIFTIPLYQREYSWTLDQVSDLYYDILVSEGESHFLGSLLLYKSQEYSNRTEIVDGQQRVTTLFILLLAITCIISLFVKYPPQYGRISAYLSQPRPNTFTLIPFLRRNLIYTIRWPYAAPIKLTSISLFCSGSG